MINSVVLMGRLTYQPELRKTPSGVSVMSFQIATDRNYTTQGEERKADFIDCTAWRSTADFIERYFNKGDMIALQGSIQTENYTDKNGNKRKQIQVVVDQVSFCGSKNNNNSNNQFNQPAPSYASADTSGYEEIADDDDLPF